MTWLWVIVGLLIVFGVVPRLGKALSRRGSQSSWDKIMEHPESDSHMGPIVQADDFTYVIAKVLKPFRVDYVRFSSNVFYLTNSGDLAGFQATDPDTAKYFRFHTQSVALLARPMDRPMGFPIWFLAAFPDIVAWINEEAADSERSAKLMGGIPESEIEAGFDAPIEANKRVDLLRKMASNYVTKVTPTLETR